MKESFKNVERLRYRISQDINTAIRKVDEANAAQARSVSSTIFATIFSGLISELISRILDHLNTSENIPATIGYSVAVIVLFCLLYFLFYRIHHDYIAPWFDRIYEESRTHDYTITHSEQPRKDFDNIACDSVIVSLEYKDSYLHAKEQDVKPELLLFYFFEMLHYVESAYKITNNLTLTSSYLKYPVSKNSDGVDIYRVLNLIQIMSEIIAFLEAESSGIATSPSVKNDIDCRIQYIKGSLADMESKVKSYIPASALSPNPSRNSSL